MDPVSVAETATVALVVQSALKSVGGYGLRWVSALYRSHSPEARQKAEENVGCFLEKFGVLVESLQREGKIPPEALQQALENPGFTLLLEQAVLAAAQTESEEKHDLLSRLLAERLTTEPESLLAVVSRQAVDTISGLTPTHLKILGLMASVQVVRPRPELMEGMPPEEAKARLIEYMTHAWAPYRDLQCSPMDFLHLLTESCVVYNPGTRASLAFVVGRSFGVNFTDPELEHNSGTSHVFRLWRNEGSLRVALTTTGRVIGIYVSDLLTGTKTDLINWR
jgi:hypothetical protein